MYKNTVTVQVYEKSVAGCIEYMENYVYFDKDGIVLETSKSSKMYLISRVLQLKAGSLGRASSENKKRFEPHS